MRFGELQKALDLNPAQLLEGSVNGRYLSGAKPFEEFATAINAELGRLNLPVPVGAPAG